MKSKGFKICFLLSFMILLSTFSTNVSAQNLDRTKINLEELSFEYRGNTESLKVYAKDDFEKFVSEYKNNLLPDVYVTEFLFDGASMVKGYDLDDFIENGNEYSPKVVDVTAINVKSLGNYEFTGEITGGMIAVNTNELEGELNLILNGVSIDSDSKKLPAIYVYNKDINYTNCTVKIITEEDSDNYIEGGKFKKVSLVPVEELNNYATNYSGTNKENYNNYSGYYGVYTKEQVDNVLFAKVQADREDLADGDPMYFYKGAGAISSDIDLTFEGKGYLEVKSKNKEGIETKGNLSLIGGTGDYKVYAYDDCLNTTTSGRENARNTLTIDVNSLIAIVDSGDDADEGDAIDSNGKLIIEGGTIVAISHPGQDSGLDSDYGIIINGGTIISTGDMYDSISSESEQNFAVFSFRNRLQENEMVVFTDSEDIPVFGFNADRTLSNLVYSSPKLVEGTYNFYKCSDIQGTDINGFYDTLNSFSKEETLGYSGNSVGFGMRGNGGVKPDRQMFGKEQTEMIVPPDNERTFENSNSSRRFEQPEMTQNEMWMQDRGNFANNIVSMNDSFEINGIANMFGSIDKYTETENSVNLQSENLEKADVNLYAIVVTIIAVISIAGNVILVRKNNHL